MPFLRKGVLLPVEGIDYTKPSTLINDRAGFPQNMRFYRNELKKREGLTKYGSVASPDSTQIMGLGKLETSSGNNYLIRASKAKIEYMNTATTTWTSISNTDLTGGDDDFVFFCNLPESDFIVFTNFIDLPRKWTGSGNNSALGGPFGKYVSYLSPYLLFAYIRDGNTYPWRVQWCDTGDPTDWTTGNAGAEECSDEPSPIQNIMKLNEYMAVYKKESLWLGRKVDTSDVFLFDCIKTGIGLSAPRAVVDVEGNHYFMGYNDFYVWNGIRTESIGGPVRDTVFDSIDRTKISRCFAVHNRNLSEIWFYTIPSGQTWATEIWKYNYRNGFWYYDTCNNLTAALNWERTSSLGWNDLTFSSWDTWLWNSWDSGVSSDNYEEIVVGRDDGYTLRLDYSSTNDDGSAVSSYFISKDFMGGGYEFNTRWLQLDLWLRGTNGGKVYVDYSTDYGDTWTNISYDSSTNYIPITSSDVKYRIYLDVVANHIRFKIRNAESGENFYLRNFYPYYLSKEEVK